MIMRRLILTLFVLLAIACQSAFADNVKVDSDAVTMQRYEQNWDDSEATLSLKNNTSTAIHNVRFLIDYFDINGMAIDYREYSLAVDIAPKMTKQVDIPAFEARRRYSYYRSKSIIGGTSFKIKFRLLGYNSPSIDSNDLASNREPDSGLYSDPTVYDVVEQMPSFPGGPSALMKYIVDNLKYPVVARANGIEGRVVVSFIVNRDGSLSDVKVERSVDPSLDREAMRVVRSMPKWIPGKSHGSTVPVRYNIPVSFRI